MTDLEEKVGKMGDDVNNFIDKQVSELSTSNSSIHSTIEHQKKRHQLGMDEPAALEI